MLDIGWTELLVIGALALIVVGPRDLPQLLRSVGQAVGKIRRMAREFQRSMEDAARDADVANFKELRDLKKDVGSLDFGKQAAKAQSYLNQPVKPDAGKVAAAAAGTTAAGKPADEAAKAPEAASAPAAPAAQSGAEERRPAAAPDPAAPAPQAPEPRQAGAKG